MFEVVYQRVDDGKPVDIIYLHFAKAFHKVILVRHSKGPDIPLSQLPLPPLTNHNLWRSYLMSRLCKEQGPQAVRNFMGSSHNRHDQKTGVP